MEKMPNALVEFRRRFRDKVIAWCNSREPEPWSQRQLAAELGRHYATVNGYLKHPDTMPGTFVELVSSRLPGLEGEWLELRRLEESGRLGNAGENRLASRLQRRRELSAAVASMKAALDKIAELMESLDREE